MAYMLNSRSGSEVAIELGDYLDKTLGTTTHLAQVKQEISGGRLLSAVSALIQESAHLWTTESAADKDIESFYALLTHFLLSPELKSNVEVRDAAIFILTKDTTRSHSRLTVLNHMYNAGTEAGWKLAFFQAIVKLAIATKQSNVLDSVLQDLDRLVHLWNISAEDKAKLHHQLSVLLAESDPWLSHVHQAKWYESFKTEEAVKPVINELTDALVAMLSRADVFQYQTIVSALATKVISNTNHDLLTLASLLNKGTYSDFTKFAAQTKLFSSTPALKLDVITTKMRILTVVDLAQDCNKIAYQTIASELSVPVEDVEMWVLDTISEGLIEAKLDHYSNSVFVSYAFRREFGAAQWTDLRDKVGKWMENVKGMISVIHDSRAQQGKVAQGESIKQALIGAQ